MSTRYTPAASQKKSARIFGKCRGLPKILARKFFVGIFQPPKILHRAKNACVNCVINSAINETNGVKKFTIGISFHLSLCWYACILQTGFFCGSLALDQFFPVCSILCSLLSRFHRFHRFRDFDCLGYQRIRCWIHTF